MKNIAKLSILTALFIAGTVMTCFASDKLNYLSVWFSEVRQDPGIVWEVTEPAGSNGYYEVENYTWSTDPSVWTPGQSVTLTVVMKTSGDFILDKKVSASSSYGTVQSVTRNSGTKATIRIQYIPKVQLKAPEGLYYEGEDSYLLRWEKVEFAGGYRVYIMKDGSYLNEVEVTGRNNTQLDLGSYVTDYDSIYSAKVKAVGPQNRTGYILESEYTPLDEEISEGSGSTASGKFYGAGEYRYFQNSDGSLATGWQQINNTWFYFEPNRSNYAASNKWLLLNGHWYHFDADAKMQVGWQSIGGKWYLLNDGLLKSLPYGAMITGWITTGPGNTWYYLYPDGHMAANETTPDGYKVDVSGRWIK